MKPAALFPLLLSTVLTVPGTALSSDPPAAYFILPEGSTFSGIGFFTAEGGDAEAGVVRLRFADEVSILGESRHGSLIWFRCAKDGSFFYLPESHLTAVAPPAAYAPDGNLPLGRELLDPARPLPIGYEPNDLEVVPSKYGAFGYEDRLLLLRREAKEKFIALIEDAEREGVVVRILSAYRSARYQSGLYGNAVAKRGVFQNGVAKPGHSEHQLGTTCDLTTDEIHNGLSSEFEGTRAFRWIEENGHRYGIFLSYPKYGERITGYTYEPWHYRYYGNARWSAPGEEGRVFFSR
jgi:D-alanyl-D-alanine carboxypeptidase